MKCLVRRKIKAAAWACFQARGVKETRADDVATKAGISRSSFYRYFRSMDEVTAALASDEGKINLQESLDYSRCVKNSCVIWPKFLSSAIIGISRGPLWDLITESHMTTIVSLIYRDRIGTYFTDQMAVILPDLERQQKHGLLTRSITSEAMAEWLLRQIWCLSSAPPPEGWSEKALIAYTATFVLPGLSEL